MDAVTVDELDLTCTRCWQRLRTVTEFGWYWCGCDFARSLNPWLDWRVTAMLDELAW